MRKRLERKKAKITHMKTTGIESFEPDLNTVPE
jgi:hypothetical protein